MIIKKFQGKTELEATEAAKKELGSNIVTMNVRSVKRKGFLRFFLKDLVEVTVALEEENEKYSPVKKEEKKVVNLGIAQKTRRIIDISINL